MNMRIICTFAGLFVSSAVMAQSPAPSAEIQIKTALLAAPEDQAGSAAVFGYNAQNEFVILRKGTGDLICLSDDPNTKGFSASCYHKDLEPLMARGRQLRKEGKEMKEIEQIREKEAKDGKLKLPQSPATLFVYSAEPESVDMQTGTVKQGYLRYVVYIPYATGEKTGLPVRPQGPGRPWLMDPGTYRAHIMISPAK